MVLREDRELLAHLAAVNGEVPELAMRLMNEELPVAEQRAFALRLVDVAEALMAHADRRDVVVIDAVGSSATERGYRYGGLAPVERPTPARP